MVLKTSVIFLVSNNESNSDIAVNSKNKYRIDFSYETHNL